MADDNPSEDSELQMELHDVCGVDVSVTTIARTGTTYFVERRGLCQESGPHLLPSLAPMSLPVPSRKTEKASAREELRSQVPSNPNHDNHNMKYQDYWHCYPSAQVHGCRCSKALRCGPLVPSNGRAAAAAACDYSRRHRRCHATHAHPTAQSALV